MNRISVRFANLILFVLGVLLFACAEPAVSAASSALSLCITSVIPSLFPFMVLSSLMVRFRLLDPVCRFLPFRKLFGLPSHASGAFLLGALCGFPIGAKTACSLYRSGVLTKEEAERTCALSANTGPAFAVGVAGSALWGSRAFGWYLYGAQLLSAVLTGLLFRKKTSDIKSVSVYSTEKRTDPIRSLAEAVSSSAAACIPLCGYIVFFSVLSAIAAELITDPIASAFAGSVLEFTTGIRQASLTGGTTGLFLTGFSLGFSGLSVLAQTFHFTSECGLSLRYTVISKTVCGLLCGVMCTLYPLIF